MIGLFGGVGLGVMGWRVKNKGVIFSWGGKGLNIRKKERKRKRWDERERYIRQVFFLLV